MTKYQHLRTDFQVALADDNLEECFKLLRTGFTLNERQQKELTLLERHFNQARRARRINTIDYDKYTQETSLVANGLSETFDQLGEDAVSFAEGIHDRILIVACKNSPTDWENLFPEAFFSHRCIIRYGDGIPQIFQSPDLVIFDALECPGISNRAQMKLMSEALPNANLLYFGKKNPFEEGTEEEKLIFPRMANANSKFTVHARLRELLEFRKIYSPLQSSNNSNRLT